MDLSNKAKNPFDEVSQKIEAPFWKQREFWVFSSIYFFVSLIELTLKLQAAYVFWFKGKLVENHLLLWSFQYYNNEQSRLLQ